MGNRQPEERPATGTDVSLAVIAGRNLVFSETRQRVYELNDTAADIWNSLRDGSEPDGVVDEMVEQGLDRKTAESYVRSMCGEWNRLGIQPVPPIPKHLTQGKAQLFQEIKLTNLQIGIRFWTAQAHVCAQVFRHLEIKGAKPDILVDVVDRGSEHQIFMNGQWINACTAEEVAPILKARLMSKVLESGEHELALHAASLVRNKRVLLICGAPNAGKTTLTLALMHGGFGFAGDDLALLDSNGRVTGVPFAAAVKKGAWPLAAGYCPELLDSPTFRRPDRKRVRYVAPHEPISARSHPVGWIVLLRRLRGDGQAVLRPLDMVEALRGIMEGADARHHRLTKSAFAALLSAIEDAQCLCLSFSRLEDAVARLQEVCR